MSMWAEELLSMKSSNNSVAFGAPGIEPRWTSSAKEGVGTAYHTSCRLWFTLSHGIVNEIYYPHVDHPNTRDFQFLITDGETFCHEEKRDLDHCIEYPERDCVFYRLTNSEPQGRYRSAFDGGGVGRCWPILTGERGHYELVAARDPLPFIRTMEDFANQGGMITEQLWDADDLPGDRMKRGGATGAAMPLCWSHAEYVSLVRSRHDGVCFDRIDPAFQRYVVNPVQSRHEIWSLRHPLRRMPRGRSCGSSSRRKQPSSGPQMIGRTPTAPTPSTRPV